MHVTLYMAMTVNGFIAKENDDTPWSEEEWESYYKIAKEIKNLVVGKRTYDIMRASGEFEKIGNPFTVILTSEGVSNEPNFAPAKSPKEALEILEKKGFSKVLVGGGGKLNASFMKEGLIDEIILDVEPMLFGKGIELFSGADFEAKLELVEVKQISKNTVQIHYRVLK